MHPGRIRYISLLLVFALLAGVFAGCQWPGETPGITSSTMAPIGTTHTAPGTTVTVPGTTAPGATQPTQPQPTIPQPTEPQPTEPQPTVPQPTDPQPTQPPPTRPRPPQTLPTGSKPTNPMNTAPSSTTVTIDPEAPHFPKLYGKNAFIYDTRTGEFLYSTQDVALGLYPASVTKLFSAYVALQYLKVQDKITVGSELASVATDASVAGLQRGDVWTVEALLYGALLLSGCDASYTLAAAAGRVILADANASASKAVSAFMAECNRLAKEMGMENTNLVNPDGYHHKDHRISMQAFAIIAECILENDCLSRVVKTLSVTVTYTNSAGKTCTKEMRNTNKTIDPNDREYYRKESVGLKTGNTGAAGGCLLGAYRVEDGYIVIGVFGCPDWDSRYADANALFDFYMEIC